jgi:hypothetical protein
VPSSSKRARTPLLAATSNLDSVNLMRFMSVSSSEPASLCNLELFHGYSVPRPVLQFLHGRARLTVTGQWFGGLKSGKIMLTRIFGDRPFIAVSKLLALCLLVGLALTAIGIDPSHLAGSLQRVVHRAANLRSGTLNWGWHCFLLGAMLVIPSWMLVHLSARR